LRLKICFFAPSIFIFRDRNVRADGKRSRNQREIGRRRKRPCKIGKVPEWYSLTVPSIMANV
jgi:hypothetical protein